MKKILMSILVTVSAIVAVWFFICARHTGKDDVTEMILSLPREFLVAPVEVSEHANVVKARIRALPDKTRKMKAVTLLKSTIIDMPVDKMPADSRIAFLWQYWVMSMNVADVFRTDGNGEAEMFGFLLEILSRYTKALDDCKKHENLRQMDKTGNDTAAERLMGAKMSDEILHDIKNAEKLLLRHLGMKRYCLTLPEQERKQWQKRFFDATGHSLPLD